MKSLKNIEQPIIKTKLPGPKAKELLKVKYENVANLLTSSVPTFISRGEGAIVEDIDGNILIDFAAGISVLNLGYSIPEVIEAVKKQADKFFHSSINVLLNEPYILLAKRMNEITPGNFKKKTMFFNSGAEANENAIKIAKYFTKRNHIISFYGGFHGRTYFTMSLNGTTKSLSMIPGPYAADIHKIPFGDCYRCSYGLEFGNCNIRCAERIKEIFKTEVPAEAVAAVILEPIQGNGCFVTPPDEFIDRLIDICKTNNILIIADEIQVGFCRSGKMFASSYWKEAPDILTSAKSIAGGLPLSSVTVKEDIIDSLPKGVLGGTFSGNPLSCVAGLEVINIMERDRIAEKAQKIGKIVKNRFELMKEKYSIIGDIKGGKGALVGLEFVKDRYSKEPAMEEVKKIIEECYQNGLIILSGGTYSNAIRPLMPLTITENQLNSGLDILEKAIKKTVDY
jgi:4-aminobutyrate aminotransferase/(S)-3-amino-2-methylpropionate transaminase